MFVKSFLFIFYFILIFTLQKQAWPDHKRECKCLQRLQPRIPTDSVRLVARIIFKLVCDIRTLLHIRTTSNLFKACFAFKTITVGVQPQGLILLHPLCLFPQLSQSKSDQEELYSIAEHQSRKFLFDLYLHCTDTRQVAVATLRILARLDQSAFMTEPICFIKPYVLCLKVAF